MLVYDRIIRSVRLVGLQLLGFGAKCHEYLKSAET